MAVTAAEAAARSRLRSRARAWLAAYAVVATVAAAAAPRLRRRRRLPGALWVGIPLVLGGYQAGRALAGDRTSGPPPEPAGLELVALAAVVAPAEELAWGGQVEPRLGVVATAGLFALKHVIVDGRRRRAPGLALFWLGLGLVRSRSPRLALALHVAVNAGGVLLGHATGRDSF